MTETSQLKPTPETRSTSPPTHNAKLRIASKVSNAFVAGVLKVSPHGDLKTLCYHNRFKERLTLIVPVVNPIPRVVGCEIACDSSSDLNYNTPLRIAWTCNFHEFGTRVLHTWGLSRDGQYATNLNVTGDSPSRLYVWTWGGRAIHDPCQRRPSMLTCRP